MWLDPEIEMLSCDWGTSHFRLRWVAGGKVVRETSDVNGCRKLFELSKSKDGQDRAHYFEEQLCSAIGLWKEFRPNGPRPIPLVISGMASSSIGWLEVSYARAPIELNGAGLTLREVAWPSPAWIGPTYLVSGVATTSNMMRGEETETIGLLGGDRSEGGSTILVLPGTHSKHLHVRDGMLEEIQTYMTGELYELLTRHSILAASVSDCRVFNSEHFDEGVRTAREAGFLAAVFLTRTRQVLAGKKPEENSAFLSGLLIGAELLDALNRSPGKQVRIGGNARLRELYGKALMTLGPVRWSSFPDEVCEVAVARGQQIILKRLLS